MKLRLSTLLLLIWFGAPAGCDAAQSNPTSTPLALERMISLQGVSGRIDHLAVDVAHHRLFVAELGNGTVEVVDLGGGPSRRISGLKEPQGLAYLPSQNTLVVASVGDGSVRFYDADTLTQSGILALGDDADNVRVDQRSGEVVVGYGSGALAYIDPRRRAVIRTVALPGHPEGFWLDARHGRAFVNIPDARRIVSIDTTAAKIANTWPGAHRGNFPMAFDETSDLLAVVYRSPSRLALIDASTGATRQDLPTCGDADDVFFDTKRRRIYVSCGSGSIDVLREFDGGFTAAGQIKTRSGARTSLFVPELDRLYVAARAGMFDQGAAIMVFEPLP